MFYYIKGTLTYSDTSFAVIETGGIGYRLTVSQTTKSNLPPLNSQAKLFTYLSVREDGIELFGFYSNDELEAFKMLINVSGVGPKVALAVLSLLTPEKFALAVTSEDAKTLSKASGVGSKTAARIVLELKDKLSLGTALSSGSGSTTGNIQSGDGSALNDAIEALTVLNYSRSEIITALRGIDTTGMSVEDIFKAATKRMLK